MLPDQNRSAKLNTRLSQLQRGCQEGNAAPIQHAFSAAVELRLTTVIERWHADRPRHDPPPGQEVCVP
jgi:hypothetical protein